MHHPLMHIECSSQTGRMLSAKSACLSYTALLYTGPDSLVDKASASGAGGRMFDSQCRRHWGSF